MVGSLEISGGPVGPRGYLGRAWIAESDQKTASASLAFAVFLSVDLARLATLRLHNVKPEFGPIVKTTGITSERRSSFVDRCTPWYLQQTCTVPYIPFE